MGKMVTPSLSPLTVHLKLSQHCLANWLYPPIQNKKFFQNKDLRMGRMTGAVGRGHGIEGAKIHSEP